ncbi:MAG TPA: carboxypeptidase-like regulatory domain-containing protein [Chitinophagaceae bacterium]
MTPGDNDIKHFSAEDISRYWEGKMSPQEMHLLEKAAMDDPFLADALEGYSTLKAESVQADVQELKNRLKERSGDRKIIPIKGNNAWWRIAAAVILLCGASVVAYNLLMRQENKEMANQKAVTTADSQEKITSVQKSIDTTVALQTTEKSLSIYDSSGDGVADVQSKPSASDLENKTGSTQPITKPSGNIDDIRKESLARGTEAKSIPSLAKDKRRDSSESDIALLQARQKSDSAFIVFNESARNAERVQPRMESVANPRSNRDANSQYFINNFSGRVLDQHNNAIPYASVRVNNNNQVASANNEGVFQIRSTDTMLDLSVTSVGFQSRSLNLRANQPQDVILEPSMSKMKEAVVTDAYSKKKSAAPSSSDLKVYVMDAQPVIGWDEYKNYLQKNKRIDSANKALTGEVVVSFLVGVNGRLSGFKVEKSLSKFHDADAIRLIQEGPQWKLLKGKRTRARVIIPY